MNEVRVRDFMTAHPTVITAMATVHEAGRSMVTGHFRHLPVVADHGLVAMVDIGDVCRVLLDSPAG